ncbi:MAG: hypothetical protein OEO17_14640 [Gemmatimonadota bacterium]|nr:hypothetical protein [Gemmatimonadota bacterium]MDH5615779.1 hypothetical protein [Acidimicrobiia bacterium]
MATAISTSERVERTPAAVASVAASFREDLERILEPGGMTRNNLGTVATWLDHGVWDLLDANDTVLAQWAAGDLR